MKNHFKFKRSIAGFLILTLLHLCWLTSFGWAEMLTTSAVVPSHNEIQTDRQRLLDLLNRAEVRKEFEKHGISRTEAVVRINSLTDGEVTEIAGKLDQLPEGGYIGGMVVLAILSGYIFFWLPGLLLFCPFSDDSYGACVSSGSRKFISGVGLGGGGGGYDDNSDLD